MSEQKPTKSSIASDYVNKYLHIKGVGKRTIANMLCEDYPKLFLNTEQARSAVRNVTGSNGKKNRKQIKIKTSKKQHQYKDLGAVESLATPEKYGDFILNDVTHIVGLFDVHVPYHDVKALTLALDYIDQYKNSVDCILLCGDFADLMRASSFTKYVSNLDLEEERELVLKQLYRLRQRYPNQRIIYKEGNHEERYERKMWERVPEFANIHTYPELMKLSQYAVEYVKDKRTIKTGKLNWYHGHEFWGRVSSRTLARSLYQRTHVNSICGHIHQNSEYTFRNGNGEVIGCWTVGGLLDLSPEYAPKNQYEHGFVDVKVMEDGRFSVDLHKIMEDQITGEYYIT